MHPIFKIHVRGLCPFPNVYRLHRPFGRSSGYEIRYISNTPPTRADTQKLERLSRCRNDELRPFGRRTYYAFVVENNGRIDFSKNKYIHTRTYEISSSGFKAIIASGNRSNPGRLTGRKRSDAHDEWRHETINRRRRRRRYYFGREIGVTRDSGGV